MTPRLRRYARALATGSPLPSALADDLVHATLMRALRARPAKAADLPAQLYATVTQIHRDWVAVGQSAAAGGAGRPTLVGRAPAPTRHGKLSAGLLSLPLDAREALLLVALEGFDHAEAARILRVSRGVLVSRLTQARTALDVVLQAQPAPHGAPRPPSRQPSRQSSRDVPYLRVVN